MITPADTNRPQPCGSRHLHIEGGVSNEDRVLCRYSCRHKSLKQHPGMGFGGRQVGRLNRLEEAAPLQHIQSWSQGVIPVSGCHAQNHIRRGTQLMQKIANTIEWLFGKQWIRSQLRQQKIVGSNHVEYGSGRAGELS